MNKKLTKSNVLMSGLLALVMGSFTACQKSEYSYNENTVTKPNLNFYALTSAVTNTTNGVTTTVIPSTLIRYNASSVSTAGTPAAITGLAPGETIVSIDYRPSNKTIYGLSNQSKIYRITTAGVATLVGAITPALTSTVSGFDINPVADLIRIVTANGQNLRINPSDATIVATDGNINGVANAVITGAAYTNSVSPAPASTELYDLDVASQKIYKQDPNTGTITQIGVTGLIPIPFTNTNVPGGFSTAYNTNITNARNGAAGGFDISPSGVALAVFNPNTAPAIPIGGLGTGTPATVTSAVNYPSTLFQIDLQTGKAVELGVIPIPAVNNYAAAANIIGLTIIP